MYAEKCSFKKPTGTQENAHFRSVLKTRYTGECIKADYETILDYPVAFKGALKVKAYKTTTCLFESAPYCNIGITGFYYILPNESESSETLKKIYSHSKLPYNVLKCFFLDATKHH